MPKILVVTFTNAVDNYGQVLQYYATQEYLSQRGHDVSVHISVPYQYPLWRRFASRIKSWIIKPKATSTPQVIDRRDSLSPEDRKKQEIFDQWKESIERNEKLHPRKFLQFKEKYFRMTKCPIEKLGNLKLDACVVGSDQTWSWISGYNFLSWAPKGAKRISIAPSVGHKSFTEKDIESAKLYLADFDLVTVREDNGIDMCHKAGRKDVHKILDPTFLLSAHDYQKLEMPHGRTKPYLLLYLLGGEIGIHVSEIYDFASKEGLDVVYVASQGREDEYPKCYAEVGEWLSLIRDAQYVFTNSFHGMAFSIIYHKQFLVFPLVGIMEGMNGRINNLSRIMSLENHLFYDTFDSIYSPLVCSFIEDRIKTNKTMVDELLYNTGL